MDASTNKWMFDSLLNEGGNSENMQATGRKILSAELDRVRLTTAGGTNTWDAGAFTISWEL